MADVTGLGRMAGGQGKDKPDYEDVYDYEHEERREKRGQRWTSIIVVVVVLSVAVLIYRLANGLPIAFPLG